MHRSGLLFQYALCVTVLTLLAGPVRAVDATADPLVITQLKEDDIRIRIDGRLDEATWEDIPWHDNMAIIDPDTLADTPYETHIRFFYTEKGLYVGVWSQQPKDTLVSRLSSRDQFISRDDISLTIDPSGTGLYGYWFSVTLGGTLQDGTVLPERQFSNRWDGPWRGASAALDDGWSAEMFLPWSMMQMPDVEGDTRPMAFYISRSVAHVNERWSWPALPRTKGFFMSALQPIELKNIKPKKQLTFYPYVSGTYDNPTKTDSYLAGFDLFWRPTTNLQLTTTINPDFGTVESDDVVVNLTNLEVFFPERRPFFLEGQEIFITSPRANTGQGRGSPTTLLNTRRIGSPPKDPDIDGLELPDLEANQLTALDGAGKLTGQSGKFRYGVLAAIEEDTQLNGTIDGEPTSVLQSGRDFGVVRGLYESTTGGGRRALGFMSTIVAHPQEDAITHGVDAHYLSRNGQLQADLQLMYSDVDSVTGAGGFLDFNYTPKQGHTHRLDLEYFDDTLDINDFGFLRRNDLGGFRYRYQVTNSNARVAKSVFTQVATRQAWNTDGLLVQSGFFSEREWIFHNNHLIYADLSYFPSRWDDINSRGNGNFKIDGRLRTGVFWRSDRAAKFNIGLGVFYRDQDLGDPSVSYESDFTWRPVDRFSFRLRMDYEVLDGWLIHFEDRDFTTFEADFLRPRIESDFFINARQQFRITLQWSGVRAFEQDRYVVPLQDGHLIPVETPPDAEPRDFTISRMTFQARYRWEIAPLSDLFVVYTRGSDIPSDPSLGFDELLSRAWTDRQVDVLVVKLRYRMGN